MGFNRLYQSIKQQTYQNIRHIVSYENNEDKKYLNGLDIDLLKVEPQQELQKDATNKFGHKYAHYNLYCNQLLDEVKEGWVLFIDDDDNLYHNKFIEEIVNLITKDTKGKTTDDEDVLFIWQMRYPNGKILPSNSMISKEEIVISNIGAPCFLFHSKYKNNAKWDSYKGSDFRFLSQLADSIPKKKFLKKIGIQINNFGDFGNRNDLSYRKNKKLPVSFYKNIFWYFLPKYHSEIFGIKIFNASTYLKIFKKFKI